MDREMENKLLNAGKENETAKGTDVESLKEKYSGTDEKIYTVITTVQVDDETEEEFTFLFRKPKPASYFKNLTSKKVISESKRIVSLELWAPNIAGIKVKKKVSKKKTTKKKSTKKSKSKKSKSKSPAKDSRSTAKGKKAAKKAVKK